MILSKARIEEIKQEVFENQAMTEKDFIIKDLCDTLLSQMPCEPKNQQIIPEYLENLKVYSSETEYPKDMQCKTKHNSSPTKPEPMPQGNNKSVLPEVVKDLIGRSDEGKLKYGTRLRINNGRDALMDAYQEALDLVMYLKQAIIERDKKCQKRI